MSEYDRREQEKQKLFEELREAQTNMYRSTKEPNSSYSETKIENVRTILLGKGLASEEEINDVLYDVIEDRLESQSGEHMDYRVSKGLLDTITRGLLNPDGKTVVSESDMQEILAESAEAAKKLGDFRSYEEQAEATRSKGDDDRRN